MTAVCTAARHNSLAAGQPTLIYYRTSGRVHDFGAAVKLASLRLRKYRACFIKCGTDTKQIPRLPPQAHQMRVRSRRSLGMTTIAKRDRENTLSAANDFGRIDALGRVARVHHQFRLA